MALTVGTALYVFAHHTQCYVPPMVAESSLRERRGALLAEPGLGGDAFCRRYAAEADAWLSDLAERVAGDSKRHLALVAVGGYGRSSLCPYSDLDVVLVHDTRRDIGAIADRIWYPVWDEGVQLDHSVRRPAEVLTMAAEDLRVALGLLDGRVVWGEPSSPTPCSRRPGPHGTTSSGPSTCRCSRPRWPSGVRRPGTWPSCSSPTSRRATADCATSTCSAPSRPTPHCWPSTPTCPRSSVPRHS